MTQSAQDSRDRFANQEVAHSSLKGTLTAERFSDGTPMRVTTPVANIRRAQSTPELERQALYGHTVCLLDPKSGFSRDELTGYVGYINPAELGDASSPTHRVTVRSTLLFCAPDFKHPNPLQISCGSHLTILATEGRYSKTHDGRYAITDHLAPIDTKEPDLAATAEKLLATPYLWGGNSAFGIDCSGLIQIACQAAHIPCPGDSDQQLARLGTALPENSKPKRNDLMFWKGHVALVYDDQTLIHANAHHMAVAFENIDQARKRIETQGDGPLLAHKRL